MLASLGAGPRYDPDELADEGLAEEDAEGIRRAMEALDRGEGIPGDTVSADILAELEELSSVHRVG